MNTVTFKGKEYLTRTFDVVMEGEVERTITIATESLSEAMGDDKEIHDTEANDLDCEIYFYVLDDEICFDAEQICENHLDEPMKFISE